MHRSAYLAIQIEKVERKKADPDLNILDFDIFPFAPAKFLKWHQFVFLDVERDCLCVQNKAFHCVFDGLRSDELMQIPWKLEHSHEAIVRRDQDISYSYPQSSD